MPVRSHWVTEKKDVTAAQKKRLFGKLTFDTASTSPTKKKPSKPLRKANAEISKVAKQLLALRKKIQEQGRHARTQDINREAKLTHGFESRFRQAKLRKADASALGLQ